MDSYKTILLIGNYGNRNTGDNAILHILAKKYQTTYNNPRIFVACRENSEEILKISDVIPVVLSIKKMIGVFFLSDIVVIGGGGIFSTYVGPRARFIPLIAIMAKMARKKVFFDSIGFYPSTPIFVKLLVNLALALADQTSVRDHASLTNIWSPIRAWKKIVLVEDPAINLDNANGQRVKEILRQENINYQKNDFWIGVSVKRVKDKYKEKIITESITKFIKFILKNSQAKIIFIPYSRDRGGDREDDYKYSLEILKKTENPRVHILHGEYLPQEILAITKLLKLSISMRFHAMLFACISKVKLIPISYAEKCWCYLEDKGMDYIKIEGITFEKLKEFYLKKVGVS